jgi:hypothetical protein
MLKVAVTFSASVSLSGNVVRKKSVGREGCVRKASGKAQPDQCGDCGALMGEAQL